MDFEDKLKVMIQHFPAKAEERNPIIIAELEKVAVDHPQTEQGKKALELMKRLKK